MAVLPFLEWIRVDVREVAGSPVGHQRDELDISGRMDPVDRIRRLLAQITDQSTASGAVVRSRSSGM